MSTQPRRLFQISDDMLALEELLEELGGEIATADIEEAVDTWLAKLGSELDSKLDGYAGYIIERLAIAKARKEEGNRLLDRARIDESRATFLKGRLKAFFTVHNFKKRETARFVLTLGNNGGVVPLVVDLPPEQLPERFRRIRYEPDNEAIRQALESGEVLPFARLGERGSSIRIR